MLDGKVNPDTGVFCSKRSACKQLRILLIVPKVYQSRHLTRAMKIRNISGLEVMDGMEFCARSVLKKAPMVIKIK